MSPPLPFRFARSSPLVLLLLTFLFRPTFSFLLPAFLSPHAASRPLPLPLPPLRAADGFDEETDVIVVGAGLGGLCAAAVLRSVYSRSVLVLESHDVAGGCAHAYDRRAGPDGPEFRFDSGPTIVLGCSTFPRNPLQQILEATGAAADVEWIPYDGWGMAVRDAAEEDGWSRWKFPVGEEGAFRRSAVARFGGPRAAEEFEGLRAATAPLVSVGASVPAMAMRADGANVVPLLRYPGALWDIVKAGEDVVSGPFEEFLNGPRYVVTDGWLRAWLDALAFSLSGLEAARTPAAAMAYVLYDLHREGSALDYPKGGLGSVVDALVKAAEKENGEGRGEVRLRSHVASIDTDAAGTRAVGVTLRNGGRRIKARDGVICNVPVWSLRDLLDEKGAAALDAAPPASTWRRRTRAAADAPSNEGDAQEEGYLDSLEATEKTRSFLHLHVALNATGLDLDAMEAHYTVMAGGLYAGDDAPVQPDVCGELNMIAVSNPCVLDRDLAPEGYIVLHAYAAGNEPFAPWDPDNFSSRREYETLKASRAAVLWEAVEAVIPDARERAKLAEVGSPATHRRFLRRPEGTYGAATEDLLRDGVTAIQGLTLCGDSVFPGIGVPAVAVTGAAAANAMVGLGEQWRAMDALKKKGVMV